MAKKKKNLHKYYKHEGGFVGLPRRVFRSPQYKRLSRNAKCLLDELQDRHMPGRNGRIVLSVEELEKLLNISYVTASKAFKELEKTKFIERTFEADYTNGKAREWRLTYEPHHGREPTDCWKDF